MTSVPQHDRTEEPSAVRRPRATGHYSESDLQVFNQGRTGGVYWFNDGVNRRGMAAWIPAAAVGLLVAVPEPRYVFGPDGPRWVPSADVAPPPVVDDESASAHRVRARRPQPQRGADV
jgi:hypothetical protein